MKVTKSARGFNQYGEIKDTYGTPLELYESSSAMCDAPLWLSIRDDRHTRRVEPTGDVLHPTVHLDRKGIKKLIKVLQKHLEVTS